MADEIDAKKIAEALREYIEKHGHPPPPTESIEIFVYGQKVVIQNWTVKETA